jgi:serine/threonine protein kinase
VVGRRISHYHILSFIGAGGMGEVYIADDTRLGRKVALKLLPAEFTQDPERARRFEREAQAASALNHPNIITIYDIEEVDGLHFIATEYVEGRTLRNIMPDTRLTVPQALEIAFQVAGALAAAHKAGIVHRDIKPENIMLREDGVVKVLDFGLAKLPEQQTPLSNAEAPTVTVLTTDPGTIMGSVNYMSPEQSRGKPVDTRSDIFSLGVVIYEMVAGACPFEGETPSDVYSLHTQVGTSTTHSLFATYTRRVRADGGKGISQGQGAPVSNRSGPVDRSEEVEAASRNRGRTAGAYFTKFKKKRKCDRAQWGSRGNSYGGCRGKLSRCCSANGIGPAVFSRND